MGYIDILAREELAERPLSNPALAKLGARALKILGYERTATDEAIKTMLGILYQYKLLPFRPETVQYYERVCLEEANDKLWLWRKIRAIRLLAYSLLILSPTVFILGFLVTGWLIVASLLIVMIMGVTIAACENLIAVKLKAVWREMPVSDYEGTIPPLALQAAVAINETIPMATITVEQLEQETIVIDPFLVVTIGQRHKQKFHFAVWDENDFRPGL